MDKRRAASGKRKMVPTPLGEGQRVSQLPEADRSWTQWLMVVGTLAAAVIALLTYFHSLGEETKPTSPDRAVTSTPSLTLTPTTTSSPRIWIEVTSLPYIEAVQQLVAAGWEVEAEPAFVKDVKQQIVLAQRPLARNLIRLVVQDAPTCNADTKLRYAYCHGRPIAHMKVDSGPTVKVGDILSLVDLSKGDISNRNWSWSQNGSSSVLPGHEKSVNLTVGGSPGSELVVSLTVANPKGEDTLAYRFTVT